MKNDLDFRDADLPYHGFYEVLRTAIILRGYQDIRNACLFIIQNDPDLTQTDIMAISFLTLKELQTNDDVLVFLNFVLSGNWQDAGLPAVSSLSYAKRCQILEIIHTVCSGIITSELNRIVDLSATLPSELPDA